ncbi:MAG: urea transporter [Ignavibacteriae bacterium]|nr:urea transporter [Ignavibacteriota bacterium]
MERPNALLDFFRIVLKSYAHTLFSERYIPALLFLAATFYDPYIGLFGLLGNIGANAVAALLHTDKNYLQAGVFGINGLLVGISVGLYVPIITEALIVLLISIVLSTVIAIGLLSSLTRNRQLPILSIPFIITTWAVLLALKSIHQETPHAVIQPFWLSDSINQTLADAFPDWLNSFLTSFGSTLFQPSVYSGVLVAIGLLIMSRISFLTGVVGGILGIVLHTWIGGDINTGQPFSSALNYIIIGIGLGGFFVAPNLSSYLYAASGVAIGVLVVNGLNAMLEPFGLPSLVAPFNIVMFIMMYPLRSQILYTSRAGLYLVPLSKVHSPEQNRKWYLEHHGKRSNVHYSLPFYGTWFVYQGEHGHHTHKGTQAYAYDFVVLDNEAKQFKGFGVALEDYYAFGLPVLAPADGRVIAVMNYIQDNPPGVVNEIHNWGNYVIIQHSETEFTEISHFKYGSLTVNVGDHVKAGQVLGVCGNSGYSPVPHLHIQRQKGPFLAAETVPIKFSNIFIEYDGKLDRKELTALPLGALVSNTES